MEATSAAGMQDQFLTLLTTQLRHQDPLEPTKQEDFLSQLAQFSTLEGIEELNDNISNFLETQANNPADPFASLPGGSTFQTMASAAGLIGKEVTFQPYAGASEKTGVVDGVLFENDSVQLRVDKQVVELDRIQEIATPSDKPATDTSVKERTNLSRFF